MYLDEIQMSRGRSTQALCKGPVAEGRLHCLQNHREAIVAGVEKAMVELWKEVKVEETADNLCQAFETILTTLPRVK